VRRRTVAVYAVMWTLCVMATTPAKTPAKSRACGVKILEFRLGRHMSWNDFKDTGTSRENSSNRESVSSKRRAKISKDSARGSSLPFKFIKPPKRTQARREVYYVCLACEEVNLVNKNTVGTTCHRCKRYNRVEDTPHFLSQEELSSYLERSE